MKTVLLAFALAAGLSADANAYFGYPSFEEMNNWTIKEVASIVSENGSVPGRFTISTVRRNNEYLIRAANGCDYRARVQWDEFGWPYIDRVNVKTLRCR